MINDSFYDPPPEWTDEEIAEEDARFDRVIQAIRDAGFSDMTDACETLMDEVDQLRTELAAARKEADRLRAIIQKALDSEIVGAGTRGIKYGDWVDEARAALETEDEI